MKHKALLLLLLAATVGARPAEYSELTPDGGQRFGHDSGPGGFHHANLSPKNSVRGTFGHTEPRSGQSFRTEYSAGRAGFIAQGAHLTRRGEDLGLNARLDAPNSKIPPPSKSYDFSWNSADQSRREASDAIGDVRGRYSYVDDVGIRRTVDYIAGQRTGFLVTNDVPDPAVSGPAAEAAYYRPSRRGAPPGPAGTRGYQSTKINADGSYRFTHSSPAQRRTERKDSLGRVLGEYSFIDDRGARHRVQYEAGPGIGFRITSRDGGASGAPNLRPPGGGGGSVTQRPPSFSTPSGPGFSEPPSFSPSGSGFSEPPNFSPSGPPSFSTPAPPSFSTPSPRPPPALRPPGAPALRPPGSPTLRPPGAPPALRPPGAPGLRPPGSPPALRPPGAPALRPPGAPIPGSPTLRPPGAPTLRPPGSPSPPSTPLRPFAALHHDDEGANEDDELDEGSAATLSPEIANERRARLRGQQASQDGSGETRDWESPTSTLAPFVSTFEPVTNDHESSDEDAPRTGVTLSREEEPPIDVVDLSQEEARGDESWRSFSSDVPAWLPDMQEDPRNVNAQLHGAATSGDKTQQEFSLEPRFDWGARLRSAKRTWSWINERDAPEQQQEQQHPFLKKSTEDSPRVDEQDNETRPAASVSREWRSDRQLHGGSLVTSGDLRYLRSRISSHTPRLAQVVSLD